MSLGNSNAATWSFFRSSHIITRDSIQYMYLYCHRQGTIRVYEKLPHNFPTSISHTVSHTVVDDSLILVLMNKVANRHNLMNLRQFNEF